MNVRQTSIESYHKIKPKLGDRRLIVLKAIAENPGRTDYELTRILGFTDPNKVRPRRKELADFGLIKNAGVKRDLHTKVNALIWVITDKGRGYLGA